MPEPIGQNQTMRMLERSLDLIAQRHQVLLSNIANEETPGYKAKDLDFRAALAAAANPSAGPTGMAPGHGAPHMRHLPLPAPAGPAAPTVITLPSARAGLDGNTVSVEKTMAAMYENSTLFAAASQILSRKYQGLLSALKETR